MQKNNDPGSRNARRFTAKWFLHPANMVLIVTFTMTLGWFLRTYNVFCRNGTQIKKFPTGEIQSEVNFRNGRRNGTARLWLRNGCLLEEKEYLDGKLNGLARAWNGDGQLALEDEWSMGGKGTGHILLSAGRKRESLCGTVQGRQNVGRRDRADAERTEPPVDRNSYHLFQRDTDQVDATLPVNSYQVATPIFRL